MPEQLLRMNAHCACERAAAIPKRSADKWPYAFSRARAKRGTVPHGSVRDARAAVARTFLRCYLYPHTQVDAQGVSAWLPRPRRRNIPPPVCPRNPTRTSSATAVSQTSSGNAQRRRNCGRVSFRSGISMYSISMRVRAPCGVSCSTCSSLDGQGPGSPEGVARSCRSVHRCVNSCATTCTAWARLMLVHVAGRYVGLASGVALALAVGNEALPRGVDAVGGLHAFGGSEI